MDSDLQDTVINESLIVVRTVIHHLPGLSLASQEVLRPPSGGFLVVRSTLMYRGGRADVIIDRGYTCEGEPLNWIQVSTCEVGEFSLPCFRGEVYHTNNKDEFGFLIIKLGHWLVGVDSKTYQRSSSSYKDGFLQKETESELLNGDY